MERSFVTKFVRILQNPQRESAIHKSIGYGLCILSFLILFLPAYIPSLYDSIGVVFYIGGLVFGIGLFYWASGIQIPLFLKYTIPKEEEILAASKRLSKKAEQGAAANP